MTQFLSGYLPHLASHSATHWDLTKRNGEFQRQPQHQQAVDKNKNAITSANSLQYYNSTKPVIIQVDASSCSLSVTLLHAEGPIEHRSKLLTKYRITLFKYRERIASHSTWSDTRSDCPVQLHTFSNYREKLTVADKVILKGTHILISKSLQADVLQKLHYAH